MCAQTMQSRRSAHRHGSPHPCRLSSQPPAGHCCKTGDGPMVRGGGRWGLHWWLTPAQTESPQAEDGESTPLPGSPRGLPIYSTEPPRVGDSLRPSCSPQGSRLPRSAEAPQELSQRPNCQPRDPGRGGLRGRGKGEAVLCPPQPPLQPAFPGVLWPEPAVASLREGRCL